jgi:hypothetical protein
VPDAEETAAALSALLLNQQLASDPNATSKPSSDQDASEGDHFSPFPSIQTNDATSQLGMKSSVGSICIRTTRQVLVNSHVSRFTTVTSVWHLWQTIAATWCITEA